MNKLLTYYFKTTKALKLDQFKIRHVDNYFFNAMLLQWNKSILNLKPCNLQNFFLISIFRPRRQPSVSQISWQKESRDTGCWKSDQNLFRKKSLVWSRPLRTWNFSSCEITPAPDKPVTNWIPGPTWNSFKIYLIHFDNLHWTWGILFFY